MKDVKSQSISRGIAVTADRGIAVIGKRIAMKNVFLFLLRVKIMPYSENPNRKEMS